MQDSEIEEKFEGGQAHSLFRHAARVAVNEATFLQRARRRRSAPNSLVAVFSALVFGAVIALFVVPIEKRVLVKGSLFLTGEHVSFSVSPEIARHVENRGDVTIRSGGTLLASLQKQHFIARVERVDWSGKEPRLILDVSAANVLSGAKYIHETELLIPQGDLRLVDILVGDKS